MGSESSPRKKIIIFLPGLNRVLFYVALKEILVLHGLIKYEMSWWLFDMSGLGCYFNSSTIEKLDFGLIPSVLEMICIICI